MKVAVVGTRNPSISYEEWLLRFSDIRVPITNLVSGGAKGIDSYVKRFSGESGIPLEEFKPDYSRYGKAAPLIRNEEIVKHADLIIAFPSKDSRGTFDTIKKAYKYGKTVIVDMI